MASEAVVRQNRANIAVEGNVLAETDGCKGEQRQSGGREGELHGA